MTCKERTASKKYIAIKMMKRGIFMHRTEEAIEQWLNSKKPYVKESTLAQYRRTVYKTLMLEFKLYDLSRLNSKKQSEFVEFLIQNYGAMTVRNTITLINQFLDFSFNNKYTRSRVVLSVNGFHPKAPKVQILNVFEQKTLTNFLIDELDNSKLGILICLYTGLRLGEICGLKWGDFDFNYHTITIKRTIQRISNGGGNTYFLISSPKTHHSKREIPIPDFLLAYILQKKPVVDENEYVVTGTEEFIQPRTYQNRLKSYLKRCGLPDYHFHTLRHTFASRAVECGVDIKALSEVLGHANTKITLDLYVHPSMEHKKREMQKLSVLL